MKQPKQFSIWTIPDLKEQNKSKYNDEGEQRRHCFKRSKAAFIKCCSCCPCSIPVLAGFLIGSLIAGIVFATILSIYLVDSSKTTSWMISSILTTTGTSTTRTTATSTSSTSTSSTSTTSTTSSTTSSTTTSTTTTAPYCTTLVTFDDIPGQLSTSGVVPNGYQNLNWTNVQYLNASIISTSGYQTAASSPPFVAYNPGGAIVTITSGIGTRFAFNSIVIASAWRDSLVWTLYGYSTGILRVSGSFPIFVNNQTIITCGSACSNWDTIQFTVSGGTPLSGLAQNGTELAFDDLCISFGY